MDVARVVCYSSDRLCIPVHKSGCRTLVAVMLLIFGFSEAVDANLLRPLKSQSCRTATLQSTTLSRSQPLLHCSAIVRHALAMRRATVRLVVHENGSEVWGVTLFPVLSTVHEPRKWFVLTHTRTLHTASNNDLVLIMPHVSPPHTANSNVQRLRKPNLLSAACSRRTLSLSRQVCSNQQDPWSDGSPCSTRCMVHAATCAKIVARKGRCYNCRA